MAHNDERERRRHWTRLALTSLLSGGLLLVGGLQWDDLTGGSDRGSVRAQYAANTTRAAAATKPSVLESLPHAHSPGSGHDHSDPATKNAISRSAGAGKETADPTPGTTAAANALAAALQRNRVKPALRPTRVDPDQPSVPTDRYNLFNACYALKSTATGRWLTRSGFTAATKEAAAGWYAKPTALGSYLLLGENERFLGANGSRVVAVSKPGPTANWTVTEPRNGTFRLRAQNGRYLAASGTNATLLGTADPATDLVPVRRGGCASFPEIAVNVTGAPAGGATSFQETRGYLDGHTHGMAFEFLGGEVHCGRPWSPWGVTRALVDCPDHTLTGGYGAAMEAFLSGNLSHDPVGWPTFKDWPASESLTHEGTYYKWMERAWRGGQRLLVNLLVENNQLCQLYPLKRNSCDDMASIRLQAKDMRDFQNYIDAQHGGPGQGWYRIVTTPEQARQVINAGKMAVVMGIETSVLFGCHLRFGQPSCTEASITKQLDEVQRLGVVQMELVNKFDNALAGVAGDSGATGYLVNAANTLETGSPWRMTTCRSTEPGVHDKEQGNALPIPAQDALFGALLSVLPSKLTAAIPALPLYPAPQHCNTLGMSDLGSFTIREMVKRKMIFDPDHMSVKARQQSLDLVESLDYSGIISSHSWSTPDAYPRILRAGGVITPYAGDSDGFVGKWKQTLKWANPATYWGIGFGADINGLGAQGNPRKDAAENPVRYPFTGFGGVRVDKQISGTRVYDLNKDGVAHYGLYPDWIEDLRLQAGQAIVDDLERGPEAYLQMWERARGIAPNACTTPNAARSVAQLRRAIPAGTHWTTVLERAGQPDRRLGAEFRYCARDKRSVVVEFSGSGRVTGVRNS